MLRLHCCASSKGFCLLLLLSFLQLRLPAQSVARTSVKSNPIATSIYEVNPLDIGDKVPDVEITNIINYQKSQVRIGDFKNKLLILDFWEAACSGCITALPKMQELQKKFKDQIQIITITSLNTEEQIEKIFNRISFVKNVKLPIAIKNTSLRKYFPFEILSHVVWIDGRGIVRAITGTDYISEANINAILEGDKINWPVKKDIADFDPNNPLLDFSDQSIYEKPKSLFYSAVLGHIDGIDASRGIAVDDRSGTITRNFFNLGVLQLCEMTISGHPIAIDPKRILFKVKDESRFIFDPEKVYRTDWEKANTFCYTIRMPQDKSEVESLNLIKADVSRWLKAILKVEVKKETRLVECLALVRINKDDTLLATKGGRTENNLDNSTGIKSINNTWFSALVGYLQQNVKNIPFVRDETNIPYNKNVDMVLNVKSFEDTVSLRKELNRYGLDIVPVKREMEMYLITEIN